MKHYVDLQDLVTDKVKAKRILMDYKWRKNWTRRLFKQKQAPHRQKHRSS
jgi:hypothetical protein